MFRVIQPFHLDNNTEAMRRPKILNTVMCFLVVVTIILFARENSWGKYQFTFHLITGNYSSFDDSSVQTRIHNPILFINTTTMHDITIINSLTGAPRLMIIPSDGVHQIHIFTGYKQYVIQ